MTSLAPSITADSALAELPPPIERIKVSTNIFRPGTEISSTKVALVLNSGGIGDYINWTPAIRYVIDSNPHIHGYVVTPPYFADLAFLWLEHYSPRFKVIIAPDFTRDSRLTGIPCVAPDVRQYANASGFHLFELGFFYYNQHRFIAPGYSTIPEIRGDEADLTEFNLPENFAVLTVNATHDNRRIPSSVINGLSLHLISLGITPVLLGKHFLAAGYSGNPDGGIETPEGVIDLREKTILREAACIMGKAKFTFGVDNGLLHLASCTGAPVISYYTTMDPQLRVPPRRKGAKTIVITPGPQLSCRFCNANMRFIIGHDFKHCLYKDDLCVKSIKPDDIIPIIDRFLAEEAAPRNTGQPNPLG